MVLKFQKLKQVSVLSFGNFKN